VSPNAESVSQSLALRVNCSAAVGLMQVLASNLGPTGTLKLLVGGAGQLRLTKDGLVLLKDMQIQHPTAALIARTATAQDAITGDGTTSIVLLVGELLRLCEQLVAEGLHPRIVADGLEQAKEECLKFLQDEIAVPVQDAIQQRELLVSVARTSLQTKLDAALVKQVRRRRRRRRRMR
jgi:T-complex protein 1 subunit zeta